MFTGGPDDSVVVAFEGEGLGRAGPAVELRDLVDADAVPRGVAAIGVLGADGGWGAARGLPSCFATKQSACQVRPAGRSFLNVCYN